MPCFYVTDSGMVHVEGLGLPSLLVCRTTSSPFQVSLDHTRILVWSWGGDHSWYKLWVLPQSYCAESRCTDSRALWAAFAPWLVCCGLCSTMGHGFAFVTSQNLFAIVARAAASATAGGPVHSDISPWAFWGRAHPGLLMKTLRYYSSGDFVRFLFFFSPNKLVSSLWHTFFASCLHGLAVL